MKRHFAMFLLAFLLGWIIFFQMSEPARSILIPWQIIYTMHNHGLQLIGNFTLSQQWTVTWRCTSSSAPWALQIDDHQGHTRREVVPCDGNERRVPFQELGSFYLAVTTDGEWMLQLEESPVEYEVVRPNGGTNNASYHQCKTHKILTRTSLLRNDCHEAPSM